jgi:hypothetical protein
MLTPRYFYLLAALPRPGLKGTRQRDWAYCEERRLHSQARDFDLLIRPADWDVYAWNRHAYLDRLASWNAEASAGTNLPPAALRDATRR